MTTKAFLKALEFVIGNVFFKDIKECRTLFYASSYNPIKNKDIGVKELMYMIHKQQVWIDNKFAEEWKEICKGDSDSESEDEKKSQKHNLKKIVKTIT